MPGPKPQRRLTKAKSSALRREVETDGGQSAVRLLPRWAVKIAPRASARSTLRALCLAAAATNPADKSAHIVAASLGA